MLDDLVGTVPCHLAQLSFDRTDDRPFFRSGEVLLFCSDQNRPRRVENQLRPVNSVLPQFQVGASYVTRSEDIKKLYEAGGWQYEKKTDSGKGTSFWNGKKDPGQNFQGTRTLAGFDTYHLQCGCLLES